MIIDLWSIPVYKESTEHTWSRFSVSCRVDVCDGMNEIFIQMLKIENGSANY